MMISELSCDILVIGSGLAGLRAAYDCLEAGCSVIQISKGSFCSGASFYPLTGGLGAQLPKDEADKETYLEELLSTGAGIASPEMYRILVDGITREIDRLKTLHIETYSVSGRPACFAKKERKLVAWRDWGRIRKEAGGVLCAFPKYKGLAHMTMLRLVKEGERVTGALFADEKNQVLFVNASAVILASGGYCGLYEYSLNTPDVAGIGQSAALDAGALLTNLEFMQFIPGLTALRPGLLFAEFSLLHCSAVNGADGVDALGAVLPENVGWKECLLARSKHGPFTTADASRYFELAMMDQYRKGNPLGTELVYSADIKEDPNPYMQGAYELFLNNGIDITKTRIHLLPYAHCCNGGVRIDGNGCTGVPGLYACGEVAGGIHGADRHGGVATASCLVFGARAAKAAVSEAGRVGTSGADKAWAEFIGKFGTGNRTDAGGGAVRKELGHLLWMKCGVERNEDGLQRLLAFILEKKQLCGIDEKCIVASADTAHALRTAEALVRSVLARTESRGSHCRTDYPMPDPLQVSRRTLVADTGEITARYEGC